MSKATPTLTKPDAIPGLFKPYRMTHGTHSLFAPSAAERNVECSASLLHNARLPDTDTIWSATGTVAHFVADHCFKHPRIKPLQFLGARFLATIGGIEQTITVDEEMCDAVERYMDWCRDAPDGAYFFGERRVEITEWTPRAEHLAKHPTLPQEVRQFGTCDHAACLPKRLIITDFKYGEGVEVAARWNFQLVLYALGFIYEYDWAFDFEDVTIRVCQPRLENFDVWETNVEELRAIGRVIKMKLIEALGPTTTYGPSDNGCRFCKIRHSCRALSEHIGRNRALAFDDLTQTFEHDPNELPLEELVSAYKSRKLWQIRMAAISDLLVNTLMGGKPIEGLRVVEGVSHRRWRNADEAFDAMLAVGLTEDDAFEKKIVTPAKALRKIPKEYRPTLQAVIVKPRGKPVVVDAADARPDYHPVDPADFDNDWAGAAEATDDLGLEDDGLDG